MGFVIFLLIILLGMLCAAGLAIGAFASLLMVWSALKLVFAPRNLLFVAKWFTIWMLIPTAIRSNETMLRVYVGVAACYTLYKIMDGSLSLFRRDKFREKQRRQEELRLAVHEELLKQKFRTVPRHPRRHRL